MDQIDAEQEVGLAPFAAFRLVGSLKVVIIIVVVVCSITLHFLTSEKCTDIFYWNKYMSFLLLFIFKIRKLKKSEQIRTALDLGGWAGDDKIWVKSYFGYDL